MHEKNGGIFKVIFRVSAKAASTGFTREVSVTKAAALDHHIKISTAHPESVAMAAMDMLLLLLNVESLDKGWQSYLLELWKVVYQYIPFIANVNFRPDIG